MRFEPRPNISPYVHVGSACSYQRGSGDGARPVPGRPAGKHRVDLPMP